MSRTYRCRHLPVHCRGRSKWSESHAYKIVDGRGGFNWKHRQEIIDEEMINTFGPKPPPPHAIIVKAKGLRQRIYVPAEYKSYKWFDILTGKVMETRYVSKPSYYKYLPGRWMKTWECFEWERLRDLVEASHVWPTATWHPWVRRPWASDGLKKWYRTNGNRWARRRDRATIRSKIIDDDWDGHFAHKREAFNWWDLY